jgi:HEPN domain-containing protein
MDNFFDKDEFDRWFNESLYTFESALHDKELKFYNWACFKFQQAGEYALKAILKAFGKSALGHSLLKLLDELEAMGISVSYDLKSYARTLDMNYIGTRYPDAYPEGSPHEFFDESSVNMAEEASRKIIEFIKTSKDKNV